jgi:hypothetical protein
VTSQVDETMGVRAFYRLVVWVPLLIPTLVAVAVHQFHIRPVGILQPLTQLLLGSLLLGGLPYGIVALSASVWLIRRRPEHEIRKLAILSPLFTIAAFVPMLAIAMMRNGNPGYGAVVFVFCATCIVGLGYAYVAAAFGLRRLLFGQYDGPLAFGRF